MSSEKGMERIEGFQRSERHQECLQLVEALRRGLHEQLRGTVLANRLSRGIIEVIL
jgi:hypothetical protein